MQTVYFFTHVTMAGAALSILYLSFWVKPHAEAYTLTPGIWMLNILSKCRTLGCITKTRVVILSTQLVRLVPIRLTRKID